MAIIVLVGMLFSKQRNDKNNKAATSSDEQAAQGEAGSLPPRTLAYGLIGVLLLLSAVMYFFDRKDAKQIIELTVWDASGTSVQYQVYKEDYAEGIFTTIDGKQVRLAQTDRVEISGQ